MIPETYEISVLPREIAEKAGMILFHCDRTGYDTVKGLMHALSDAGVPPHTPIVVLRPGESLEIEMKGDEKLVRVVR